MYLLFIFFPSSFLSSFIISGWFSSNFIFSPPKLGEDEPNLTSLFFTGWFNHQLDMYGVFFHQALLFMMIICSSNAHLFLMRIQGYPHQPSPQKNIKRKSTLSKVKVQEIIIAPSSKKKSGLLNP